MIDGRVRHEYSPVARQPRKEGILMRHRKTPADLLGLSKSTPQDDSFPEPEAVAQASSANGASFGDMDIFASPMTSPTAVLPPLDSIDSELDSKLNAVEARRNTKAEVAAFDESGALGDGPLAIIEERHTASSIEKAPSIRPESIEVVSLGSQGRMELPDELETFMDGLQGVQMYVHDLLSWW